MQKTEKQQVIDDLTERLRSAETLIVADYRGLTNKQIQGLRGTLGQHGARLQVVKNTLTRRAAEAAGADALLALLEGPTALAFVEADGDAVAVAKALADVSRETKVLTLRGGVLSGRTITGADVEELAKLPPADVIKSQLVGAIIAPLTQLLALVEAPVRDLVGLIDARIEQLEEGGDSSAAEAPAAEPAADAEETPASEEPDAAAEATDEPTAEAEVETAPEEGADEPQVEAEPDTGEAVTDTNDTDDTKETENGD